MAKYSPVGPAVATLKGGEELRWITLGEEYKMVATVVVTRPPHLLSSPVVEVRIDKIHQQSSAVYNTGSTVRAPISELYRKE